MNFPPPKLFKISEGSLGRGGGFILVLFRFLQVTTSLLPPMPFSLINSCVLSTSYEIGDALEYSDWPICLHFNEKINYLGIWS
jgi:hypothetical protein